MSNIVNQVAALRIQKGMTQKELADACSVDIRTIQRIEAGVVVPRMHTIKLLANILGSDAGFLSGVAIGEKTERIIGQLKWPFWAGVIFTINAILVVYDLSGHFVNAFFHVSTMLVHMISCVFFFRGFYLLGKYYNNGTMAITSMLSMILLPLVSIMYLLPAYFNSYILFILYLVLCITEVAGGIGFILEGYKRKTKYQVSLYTLAGLMIIVQTVLCLGQGSQVVNAGLIISLFSNIITTLILYMERHSGKSLFAKDHPARFQHKAA